MYIYILYNNRFNVLLCLYVESSYSNYNMLLEPIIA